MNQKSIGTRIAELRKEKGLTQNEVVEKCNINIRTLQRIESNQVQPRMYTVRALLEAMDYDLDILSEPNQTNPSANLKQKATHFFDQAVYMFNQNKSIMKKVMLTVFMGAIAVFIVSMGMTQKNKHPESDQLIGTWRLVKTGTQDVSSDGQYVRHMKFDGNYFVSFDKNGNVFNGGKYLSNTDGDIVTIHAHNGILSDNPNYFTYEFNNDTMVFKGNILYQASSNSFKRYPINEIWVKVEDIKFKNEKSPIADLIIY